MVPAMRTTFAALLFALGLVALVAVGSHAEPRVSLVPGGRSHGYGEHEFRAGARLLAEALNASGAVHAEVNTQVDDALDPSASADAFVLYMDGGKDHPVLAHLDELDRRIAAGAGLVVMHFALEVPNGPAADAFGRWIGGSYESGWSTNPVWRAELALDPTHPVSRGVAPFAALDEWYFNLRFPPEAPGFRAIATAVPDDEARADPTWPPFAQDHIVAASGRRETLVWSIERPDGGRGVGFSGGHFHWNWGNDDFRRLVLNAIVWAAGAEVPEGGVVSATPTFDGLAAGQDERQPWLCFDREATMERFGLR